MTRAGVAELKANLSAFLRRVREGESVTVMDRDTPIARIIGVDAVDAESLPVRRARKRLAEIARPRPLRTRVDVVALLMEERGER